MKAKYARFIRIGIMSRCRPYLVHPDGHRVMDTKRLSKYTLDYYNHAGNRLVIKARERTAPWVSERPIEE